MPQFDLRYIKVAKYKNSAGAVTYEEATSIGDAMSVDIQLKYVEGRVYAEGTLAEYLKKATGGTIAIAEKYIPVAAQKMMFGARDGSRNITVNNTQTAVASLKFGGSDKPKYVGTAFYAPDIVDGVEKYTCVFITRALFGMPGMSLKTMGDAIQFATPTASGEFLADHQTGQEMIEIAIVDDAATAMAWVDYVLGYPSCATPIASPAAGAVVSGAEIALSCATAGATIYYTTNGAEPTDGSIPYDASNKPTVTAATTIKAIAYKVGCAPSGVLTAAYTLS